MTLVVGVCQIDQWNREQDDIHEMRVQLAGKHRNMSPEEAERDFQMRVENTRRAIEEARRQKSKAVV